MHDGQHRGTAVPTFLGAYMGSTAWAGNFYAAIHAHYTLPTYVLLGIVLISITVSCTMQIYCAALSCMTLFYTMWPTWRPTARSRGLLAGGLLLLSVLLTIMLSGDILHILNSFIEFLLAVLSPWTAINLVDYYLIRHGDYDIRSFFVMMAAYTDVSTALPFSVTSWVLSCRCPLFQMNCIPA